jgi:phosphohistidine phosphatase SixA
MRVRKAARAAPLRLLLRHADAGGRSTWTGPDDWRPLSPLGWEQAADIPDRVAGTPILRILSSPSLRCRQTVVPLARALGLDVEPCRELCLGADPWALIQFLQDPETDSAVLCTHRETLETFLAVLGARGTAIPDAGPTMAMAAAWRLQGAVDGGIPPRLQLLPASTQEPAARVG